MPNGQAVVVQHTDLYELLYHCRMLITQWSTIGFEAVLLNKPLIIVNFGASDDLLPYAAEKVAVRAANERHLAAILPQLLTESELYAELAERRTKFISKHMYSADGLASLRTADMIKRTGNNLYQAPNSNNINIT